MLNCGHRSPNASNPVPLHLPCVLLAIAMSIPAENESFVASNLDRRTVLGFAARIEAVRNLLPDGWEPDVATSGPAKDINLRVTLIDTLAARDALGREVPPPRIAHVSVPARRIGEASGATMLLVAFSTGGDGGPYGNSIQANARIEGGIVQGASGVALVDEGWRFDARDGHRLVVRLSFERGAPVVAPVEDRVHSAAKPGFHRIYRTEQALDLVSRERLRSVEFEATGPMLSALFEGSGAPISVTSVPWYSRNVFVPR